jgi:putative ABC transport system permease protein
LDREFSLSEIRVLYTGKRDLEETASEIESLLGNTRVLTQRRTAGKQIAILESIHGYALLLLLVILVLGWLSIANEMYLNAHARRREIATLIALGATTSTILLAFLMKAVLLALLGGVLGYGLGTLTAAHLGPALLRIEVPPDVSLIPLAVVAAVLFSALSALLPAWRASRIEPAEILQED